MNENFFKAPSPEREWVLGFIFADGCISLTKNIHFTLGLAQKEPEILQKIKNLLQTEAPIKRINKTGCHILRINNKKLVRDLLQFGLHPRKSLTIEYPENIKYHSHFIRGFFDGDGCVSLIRYQYTNKISLDKGDKIKLYRAITFHSASKQFLIELCNHLPYVNPFKNHLRKEKGNCYRLGFYGKPFVEKIVEFLYKDSSDEIRLSRKYKRCVLQAEN
ncbi:MAG: hypothetical protein HWN65_21595 [Candidatus Helarchaeota archaeon]|nr:hypothetical protein [Candidatus Helarchaeota archaeon]